MDAMLEITKGIQTEQDSVLERELWSLLCLHSSTHSDSSLGLFSSFVHKYLQESQALQMDSISPRNTGGSKSNNY